jgi:uncharacterized phage protein (TIGR01671 family)
MNREIKFRAWDSRTNEWLLGYERPNLGGFSLVGEVMMFGEYEKMLASFPLKELDKLIIMQYTELKDRNGKEIYEGDMVRTNNNVIMPVTFEYGSFIVKGNDIRFAERTDDLYYAVQMEIEVIGNIYENPELLNPTTPAGTGE